jgi:hypothetical protein
MIKTTQEYFNLTVDELLHIKVKGDYTKEENLLFDDGLEVVFFDSEQEIEDEKEEFNEYINSKRYEIKEKLKTVNERIAVVLI